MNRVFFILLILLSTGSNLYAKIDSTDKAVASILNKDDQINDAAIFLVEKCDPKTFHFIEAAANGYLYNMKNEPIGLIQNKRSSNYFKLYPIFEAIDSEKISKESLEKIIIPRSAKLEFKKIIPIVNMSSADQDIRMEAYREVSDLKQTEMISYVREALKKENDKKMILAGNNALYSLLLYAGSEKEQIDAIGYFEKSHDALSIQKLNDYLSKKNISEKNRSKVKDIVKDAQSYQQKVDFLQNIFSGLSLGSILIMTALGLSIIYGLAGIINMSHGEFIMIGAYTTFCMQQLFIKFLPSSYLDIAFFVSLPVSFIVTSLFGLLIERLVIKHLYHRPLESLLATWGVSLILIQLARNIFGDLTSVQAPSILSGGLEVVDGLILPYNRLFIIGLTLIMFLLVYYLFKKSMLGIKIRAVTQNRNMSASLGINTKKIDMLTFMLGSGLAGVAGCAITLVGNVVPNMGQTYIVDSFLVVVTGGVGKLIGCVVSGLGIGVLSKILEASFEAVYGKVFILVFIIIFLQFKPKGLFPDKGRIGDD